MDGCILVFYPCIFVYVSACVCVCVCVCVSLCLSVRLSRSAIHVSFVGLNVSYCSWVSLYFLSVFLCCFCLCAILFFYGPCCLNKINDDDTKYNTGFRSDPSSCSVLISQALPTTKELAIVSIQQNIVKYISYREIHTRRTVSLHGVKLHLKDKQTKR